MVREEELKEFEEREDAELLLESVIKVSARVEDDLLTRVFDNESFEESRNVSDPVLSERASLLSLLEEDDDEDETSEEPGLLLFMLAFSLPELIDTSSEEIPLS